MLSSLEAWYGVQKEDFKKLEKLDGSYLKKVVECTSQITYEMLYLELGVSKLDIS